MRTSATLVLDDDEVDEIKVSELAAKIARVLRAPGGVELSIGDAPLDPDWIGEDFGLQDGSEIDVAVVAGGGTTGWTPDDATFRPELDTSVRQRPPPPGAVALPGAAVAAARGGLRTTSRAVAAAPPAPAPAQEAAPLPRKTKVSGVRRHSRRPLVVAFDPLSLPLPNSGPDGQAVA